MRRNVYDHLVVKTWMVWPLARQMSDRMIAMSKKGEKILDPQTRILADVKAFGLSKNPERVSQKSKLEKEIGILVQGLLFLFRSDTPPRKPAATQDLALSFNKPSFARGRSGAQFKR